MKREKGKYFLTVFGKMIYNAQSGLEAKIENALQNYWKLKAIDLLKLSGEERNKLVASLIESQEIRNILLNQEALPKSRHR